jgi:hypothetical protein
LAPINTALIHWKDRPNFDRFGAQDIAGSSWKTSCIDPRLNEGVVPTEFVEVMMLLRMFRSLPAFAVVAAAAGFYYCTAGDGAECDRACVMESGEEPLNR